MSVCKSCGREIYWGKNFKTGKTVPLEICKNAYRQLEEDTPGEFEVVMVNQITDETIFISHFLTCNDPNRFSKGKKKEVA